MKQQQIDFIGKIAPLAQKYGQIHDVCTSMTIAQAILESGWGKSCIGGFALFGVKGKGLKCTTKEYINGKWITITDSFEVYKSFEDSFKGYYAFLENNARYRKFGIFGEWDYKKACKKIFSAGYATGKNYDSILIGIIEDYKLFQYDKRPKNQTFSVTFTDISTRGECETIAANIGKLGYKNHKIIGG